MKKKRRIQPFLRNSWNYFPFLPTRARRCGCCGAFFLLFERTQETISLFSLWFDKKFGRDVSSSTAFSINVSFSCYSSSRWQIGDSLAGTESVRPLDFCCSTFSLFLFHFSVQTDGFKGNRFTCSRHPAHFHKRQPSALTWLSRGEFFWACYPITNGICWDRFLKANIFVL